MKLRKELTCLIAVAVLSAITAFGQAPVPVASTEASTFTGPAPNSVRLGNAEYSGVRGCAEDEYNFALTILPTAQGETLEGFDLVFGVKDDGNGYRVVATKKDIQLVEVHGGKAQILESAKLEGQPNQRRIEVQRRGSPLTVIVDGKRTLFSLNSDFGRGWVGVASQQQAITVRNWKYQGCADIVFEDDFTRHETETSSWENVRGAWRVFTTHDTVAKKLSLQTGKEPPKEEKSPNFFYFTGKSDEKSGDGLAAVGYDFWDGYDAAASVQSSGGAVGLVFYLKDAENYYLLRWWLMTPREVPQPLELVRIKNGQETVLARAAVVGASKQWYRLEVLAEGARLRALVDGCLVFDVQNDGWMVGKAGLYEKGADNSVFDDMSVNTLKSYDFDTSEMLGVCGGPESGDWSVKPVKATGLARETSRDSLEYKGGGSLWNEEAGLYWIGDPSWSHYAIGAHVVAPADGAVGFAVRGQDGSDLILRIGTVPDRKESYTQLLLVNREGVPQILAEAPGGMPKGVAEIKLDLTEKGKVEAYLAGELRLRAKDPLNGAGRPGVYSTSSRGATFQNTRVMFVSNRDIGAKVKKTLFATDKYMMTWANDFVSWVKDTDASRPDTYWHRSDFFDRVELFVKDLGAGFTAYLATTDKNTTDGYALTLTPATGDKPGKVELDRAGKPVAQADLTVAQCIAPCNITRDGAYVWVTMGDKEVLSYRDAQPLRGTCLAMKAGTAVLKSTDVRQYNVKDYLFDKAPCDWHTIGAWEETNRFACLPEWAWFAAVQWDGLGAIWNKTSFSGDVTVEFYAGMRMSPGTVNYPRPGDINVTICGANDELSAGYNTIFAAWDPFWTGKRSYLMRGLLKVAETDRELIPLNREHRGDDRVITQWWDPGGRGIHGAWYYIKVRKQGDTVRCYFDDIPVMEYRDPNPLTGRDVALWTQMDSIVVARVRIAYQEKLAPKLTWRPLPVTGAGLEYAVLDKTNDLKSTDIVSSTHPGVMSDFEMGLDGWKGVDGDQGAYVSLDLVNPGEGKSSLKLTNVNSGGTFGALVPMPAFQPFLVQNLSFMYRIPPESNAKVNIYLRTKPAGRTFYVRLTGPEQPTGDLIYLGKIDDVKTDGKWHSATFPLSVAMTKWAENAQKISDIDVTAIQCDEMKFGCYHEGYVRAGLGGNPHGAAMWLDDFRLVTVGPPKAKFSWFDGTLGASRAWSFSYGAPEDPGVPQQTGKAEAEFTADKDGLWYFNLKQFDDQGNPIGIRRQAFCVEQAPLKVAGADPRSGSVWGGEPIRITFEPFAAANVLSRFASVSINGTELGYQPQAMHFDWDARQLVVLPNQLDSVPVFKDGDPVHLTVGLSKFTMMGQSPKTTCDLAYTYGSAADHTPPTTVALSGYPMREDFENLRRALPRPDGQTSLCLDSTDPASGQYCLKVVASRLQSPMTLILKPAQPATDLNKNPLLVFDYKMPSATHVNLYLETNGGSPSIHFTDTEVLVQGSVPEVVADETWRHAEVNLRQILRNGNGPGRMMELNQIRICDQNYVMGAAGTYYCIDNVALIPSVNASKDLTLSWTAQDTSSVKGYSYTWNSNPIDDPDETIDSTTPSHSFANLSAGTQYFHVRAVDAAGNWGPTSHYRFLVEKPAP